MLENAISNYLHFTANKKWLYFIALKLFGAKTSWCLATASQKATNADDFPRQVYRCLLDKSVNDKDFWECYDSRKTVLQYMGNPSTELSSYCKLGIYGAWSF